MKPPITFIPDKALEGVEFIPSPKLTLCPTRTAEGGESDYRTRPTKKGKQSD